MVLKIVEIIYALAYLIALTVSIVGVYIYSRKKLRQKVNLKEVWQFFWIMLLLRLFDIISTIYFTNKIGIQYEGNILARDIMFQFGIIPGMLLVYIIQIPLMFFWFVWINYRFKKNKKYWRYFKIIMVAISVIIPSYNFSV
jgi:tetrahydromethanopterin S-methyltransferase subunit G